MGEEFLRSVEACVRGIQRHPEMYPVAIDEFRRAPIRRFPFEIYHGKGGKAGARSRLETIVEKFPHYSRFDEVLLLLGRLNMTDGRHVEAATLFRKLIATYPASQYSAEAAIRLLEIDALKSDSAPKP